MTLRAWLVFALAVPACTAVRPAPAGGGDPRDPEDAGGNGGVHGDDIDSDGDGFVAEEDCDDADATIHNGAVEVEDGVDNDCDEAIDCDDPDMNRVWGGRVKKEDIPDFCEASCSRVIHGELWVDRTTFTDLSALWCLTRVDGDVSIESNDHLASLAGLERLEHTGELWIRLNDALGSLAGLDALTEIDGALYLQDNPGLTTLAPLANLRKVEDVFVANSDGLTSLDGLDGVTRVHGLDVWDNPALTSLRGLDNVEVVDGELAISGNPALTTLEGLDALEYVRLRVTIVASDGLVSLDGLGALAEIGESLEIGWAPAGYGDTTNPALTDVTALYGLDRVGQDVRITDNPQLGDAAARDLVDQIEHIGGQVTIADNG